MTSPRPPRSPLQKGVSAKLRNVVTGGSRFQHGSQRGKASIHFRSPAKEELKGPLRQREFIGVD